MVIVRTSLLDVPTEQEHRCHWKIGNRRPAKGREGSKRRNALDTFLWAQCNVNPAWTPTSSEQGISEAK